MHFLTDADILGPQPLVVCNSRTGFDPTDETATVLASLLKASKKRYYSVSGPFDLAARLCSKD
jgi:hypothetical protein